MNSVKLRMMFLGRAEALVDTAFDRAVHNEDPVTGEAWEGSVSTFNILLKAVVHFATQADEFISVPGYDERLSPVDAIRLMVQRMYEGQLTPQQCKAAVDPLLSLVAAADIQEAEELLEQLQMKLEGGTPYALQ